MDTYDLNIYQGSSFALSLTLKDSCGSPINLSGYEGLSGFIKYRYSDSGKLADLNPTKLTPYTSGKISLSISADVTSSLPVTVAVYDIETYSGINVQKVLAGRANIFPQATY